MGPEKIQSSPQFFLFLPINLIKLMYKYYTFTIIYVPDKYTYIVEYITILIKFTINLLYNIKFVGTIILTEL